MYRKEIGERKWGMKKEAKKISLLVRSLSFSPSAPCLFLCVAFSVKRVAFAAD
jgi:hypothetical protein